MYRPYKYIKKLTDTITESLKCLSSCAFNFALQQRSRSNPEKYSKKFTKTLLKILWWNRFGLIHGCFLTNFCKNILSNYFLEHLIATVYALTFIKSHVLLHSNADIQLTIAFYNVQCCEESFP